MWNPHEGTCCTWYQVCYLHYLVHVVVFCNVERIPGRTVGMMMSQLNPRVLKRHESDRWIFWTVMKKEWCGWGEVMWCDGLRTWVLLDQKSLHFTCQSLLWSCVTRPTPPCSPTRCHIVPTDTTEVSIPIHTSLSLPLNPFSCQLHPKWKYTAKRFSAKK
jgi:hypothetical protein